MLLKADGKPGSAAAAPHGSFQSASSETHIVHYRQLSSMIWSPITLANTDLEAGYCGKFPFLKAPSALQLSKAMAITFQPDSLVESSMTQNSVACVTAILSVCHHYCSACREESVFSLEDSKPEEAFKPGFYSLAETALTRQAVQFGALLLHCISLRTGEESTLFFAELLIITHWKHNLTLFSLGESVLKEMVWGLQRSMHCTG